MSAFNAYARPPQAIKDEFKQRQSRDAQPVAVNKSNVDSGDGDTQGYAVDGIPGLIVYPALIPPHAQLDLLNKLFERDLLDSQHNTNVHMHYAVPYPSEGRSFFDLSSRYLSFEPKDPAIHKPFTTETFLNKKLRWLTLGGQYDWTNKRYPNVKPPAFPMDIKQIVERAFPMNAEAAIVNLYSPGDTLSLHRDVSEECNKPLASISIGCDCEFVIGLDTEEGYTHVKTIRLRSGDAVLMAGSSRYAWHGVPKVIEGTCPAWLKDWPGDKYEHWKGWMSGKRINLNVRQMFEEIRTESGNKRGTDTATTVRTSMP